MKSAHQIITQAIHTAIARDYPEAVRVRLEDTSFASRYSEPGYIDPENGIVFGNWNSPVRETSRPGRFFASVVKQLESAGVELQWSDEWTTCADCQGALRTSPDCYGWQPAYIKTDDGEVCRDCAAKHPEDTLELFIGNPDKALSIKLDLPALGFVRVQSFEHGMHPGQDASPQVIAATLGKLGVSRFVFTLDSTGQFDIEFSLWVDKSEASRFRELSASESEGESVSGRLKRGLMLASKQAAELRAMADKTGSIVYSNIDGENTTTRLVSPDQLINGIKS